MYLGICICLLGTYGPNFLCPTQIKTMLAHIQTWIAAISRKRRKQSESDSAPSLQLLMGIVADPITEDCHRKKFKAKFHKYLYDLLPV